MGFSGKKKVVPKIKDASIQDLLNQELQGYIKREDLQRYLDKIQHDKETKRLWDMMSIHQKIKLLRHIASKRGIDYEKRRL
jgi:hypothetical protein